MNWLLIVGILIISTAPLHAQRQQQNVAKLKEDARNAVGVIGADKHKTRTFCQILELEPRQADEENNKNKKMKKRKGKNNTEALSRKIDQLQKQLGPESVRLDNILQGSRPKFPRWSRNRFNNPKSHSILSRLAVTGGDRMPQATYCAPAHAVRAAEQKARPSSVPAGLAITSASGRSRLTNRS